MAKQSITFFLNSKLSLLLVNPFNKSIKLTLKIAEPAIRQLYWLTALPCLFLLAAAVTAFSHKLIPSGLPPVDLFIAPLLLTLKRLGRIKTVWVAFFCGVYVDLLSLFGAFGVCSTAFVCSLYLCCRLRQHISEGWLLAAIQSFLFALATSSVLTLSLWLQGLLRQLDLLSYIKGELFCIGFEGFLATASLLFLKKIDTVKERNTEDFFEAK